MKLSRTLTVLLLTAAASGSTFSSHAQKKAVFKNPVDTNALKLFNQSIDSYQPDLTYHTTWEPIAERQITWTKRVWRTVTVANPANHYLATPSLRSSFASILFNGVLQGSYKVYSATDERFSNQLSPESIRKMLATAQLKPADIKSFRVKEDWIYNAREDKLVVRIIGIAPLVATTAADGKTEGQPAFWLYYPYVRPYLAQHAVGSTKGSAIDNLDKVFELRQFSGTIEKVSEGAFYSAR